MNLGIRRLAGALALAAALGLAPGAALADTAQGKALVVGKDVEGGLIYTNGGKVLHVTATTSFADANGSRISLAELPVAEQVAPGMVAASPEATIRWEGSASGDRIVAHRVEVTGVTLE